MRGSGCRVQARTGDDKTNDKGHNLVTAVILIILQMIPVVSIVAAMFRLWAVFASAVSFRGALWEILVFGFVGPCKQGTGFGKGAFNKTVH